MPLRVVSRLRRDRAFLLGLLCGTLVSVAGLVGYVGVPVVAGDHPSLVEGAASAGFDMAGRPLAYHGLVVVLPSFVASAAGTLLLRRWGLTGRGPLLELAGGIVLTPLLAIVLAYAVTAVGVGAAMGLSSGGAPGDALVGSVAITVWALIFGVFAVAIAVAIVVPGVLLGTAAGYLVALGVIRAGGAAPVDEA
ncbi:hypothetical protein [Candidatus Halobonum tyrrellensis]|uniref:hypothetical protein n=1 Tax=Candidatus Halobonum tyrrellensis TaxID=1431545 RepID=UPI0012694F1A|nr:hypothetical protein [Candidatus Halobonum tyrrellensis]